MSAGFARTRGLGDRSPPSCAQGGGRRRRRTTRARRGRPRARAQVGVVRRRLPERRARRPRGPRRCRGAPSLAPPRPASPSSPWAEQDARHLAATAARSRVRADRREMAGSAWSASFRIDESARTTAAIAAGLDERASWTISSGRARVSPTRLWLRARREIRRAPASPCAAPSRVRPRPTNGLEGAVPLRHRVRRRRARAIDRVDLSAAACCALDRLLETARASRLAPEGRSRRGRVSRGRRRPRLHRPAGRTDRTARLRRQSRFAVATRERHQRRRTGAPDCLGGGLVPRALGIAAREERVGERLDRRSLLHLLRRRRHPREGNEGHLARERVHPLRQREQRRPILFAANLAEHVRRGGARRVPGPTLLCKTRHLAGGGAIAERA